MIIQNLMRMDPQQRNAVIMKNPQLQMFLQHYEQQRNAALQQPMNPQMQAKMIQQQQQRQIQQQRQQMSGHIPGQIPGQMPGQVPQPQVGQKKPSLQQQQQPKRMVRKRSSVKDPLDTSGSAESPMIPQGVPSVPPGPNMPFPPNRVQSEIPPGVPGSQQQIPIPLPERLQDVHKWSKELEEEGKEVPTSIRVYEQMIDRDLDYGHRSVAESKKPFNAELLKSMSRDLKYYQTVRDSRLKAIGLSDAGKNIESIWGDGYSGYGNGFSAGKTRLVFPKNRKRHSRVPEDYIPPEAYEKQAVKPDELVPIRLEFDVDRDSFKLNDTFLWNLNEGVITVERFAQILMEDYRFPNGQGHNLEKIVSSIKEQISEYHPMVYGDFKGSDMRLPIFLDITIGNNHLVDKFDWDIANSENDYEEFARVMCDEMALPNAFVTAISHSIREQCQIYVKSLFSIGYKFDGSAVTSEEFKDVIRSSLDAQSVIRPRTQLQEYTPSLQEVSFDTLEKLTKERERESRRKKRGQTRVGRRGGVVMPDLHDLPKTYRTPVPSTVLPSGIDLGPPVDSYMDFPLQVEVPEKQLRDLEQHRARERAVASGSEYDGTVTGSNGVSYQIDSHRAMVRIRLNN
ncbi:hypothetical protein OGAPHI_001606 [Ogataea philodendri]|uniref:Uncharacterized protein n=1 Tax=Ogataea philodendri TaxID=1378263 RepID=A0A9P8T8Q8_9ASCO|nr:uncharacterized protein OGAPHI_001606 [Ogataea philodendri]KAH3669485.1 hypothetical protein OGAPHI_001606 [Ogataea philodendri]